MTGSFEIQMHACASVALSQNKNEQLYKSGSARGDAWLWRISANNLLTLENSSGLLKTLIITAMSNSLWSTLKKNGINLVPIRPSNPLLHPSVNGYPIKKCILISFTSRLSKRNKRKEEINLSRTVRVLLLIFTFSLISEFHVFLLLLWFAMELDGVFLFVFLVLFLTLSSAFIFFIIILIYLHARFFCFCF